MRPSTLFALALIALTACAADDLDDHDDDDGGGMVGGGGGGVGGDPGTPPGELGPLTWEPCATFTGQAGDGATCARVSAPSDWDDGSSVPIELFVKRIGGPAATRHIWLLSGGPGYAGDTYEILADAFVDADPSFAFYLLDHRGVGRSSRLGCPQQEANASDGGFAITVAETEDCLAAVSAQWGDALAHFNVTQAARDLSALIAATREPAIPVIVDGGSYGSFWAQRYLQLHPAQADAVRIVGIVNPRADTLATYDDDFELTGAQLMQRCAADEDCSARLGPDPLVKMRSVVDSLATGHCSEAGMDRDSLRLLFGSLLMFGYHDRALIPAIIHRLERCDSADVDALYPLALALKQPPGVPSESERFFSSVLQNHITFSEMYADPPSLEAVLAADADDLFSFGLGAMIRPLYDGWPRYQPDAFDDQLAADVSIPVQMVQGDLDPATPLYNAQVVGDHFVAPGQDFVVLPNASHSLISPTTYGGDCEIDMRFTYYQDPYAPPLACVDLIEPLSFAGNSALAQGYLGTADIWDNPEAAPTIVVPAHEAAAVARTRDRVVRTAQRFGAGIVPPL